MSKLFVTSSQKTSLVRALTRRFGHGISGYSCRHLGPGAVLAFRCTDNESGSWVEGIFVRGRLSVTAEHDGAALAPVEPETAPEAERFPLARSVLAEAIGEAEAAVAAAEALTVEAPPIVQGTPVLSAHGRAALAQVAERDAEAHTVRAIVTDHAFGKVRTGTGGDPAEAFNAALQWVPCVDSHAREAFAAAWCHYGDGGASQATRQHVTVRLERIEAPAMVAQPAQQQQARDARRGMARCDYAGSWQIGIYRVDKGAGCGRWVARATGPGTIGNGEVGRFDTLAEAYEALTGEPMPGAAPRRS